MKRYLILLLTFLFILTGCTDAAKEGITTVEPAETQEAVTVVHSVDELLSAIAPGAIIELGEGEFNLTSASDYGERKGPYYVWEELGTGNYGLKLQYLENLTIRGAGMDKTSLVTDPRWPHVLSLADCKNVTLEGMTIGHTQAAEACEGGVVYLDHCEAVRLQELGLFGCGTIGVWATACKDVDVAACDIYDCTGAGVSLSGCVDVRIRDSKIYSLGKEMPVMSCFDIWNSQSVTVDNCTIRDNYADALIRCGAGCSVTFAKNHFADNKIAQTAFAFDGDGVVFDANVFADTGIRSWYRDFKALDPDGNVVEFEAPEAAPAEPGVAEPVTTGKQKEVRVKTVDQFLSAIASDTKIILAEGEFDLSTAKNYGKETKHCYWEDNYDGPSLVIHGVSNLTIEGAGQDKTTISAVPRYANVLTFENCFAITVKNLTAGHTKEPGYCMGGVLLFRRSDSLLVESCGLYGCGTHGVQTQQGANLQIINCEIYECSYGGVWFQDSENITISGTTFRDLGGPAYQLWNCVNVTTNGDSLDGNYTGD